MTCMHIGVKDYVDYNLSTLNGAKKFDHSQIHQKH